MEPHAASSGLRASAERLAHALPPLLVAARLVAANVAQGAHGRRRVGQGDAFWQYRRYQTGDAATTIDWRPSAKSSHLFIREREWEAAETIWIWCDASASMRWRSSTQVPTKIERAGLLSLALSVLAIKGGERIGLIEGQVASNRPMAGPIGLTRLARRIDARMTDAGSAAQTESVPPLRQLGRHGQVVLISDFLRPPADIAESIRAYAGQGLSGHLLQVLDPAEEHLPFEGRVELSDPESGAKLLLGRADKLREDYEARLAAHRMQVRQAAAQYGWSFLTHITNRPAPSALLSLYLALAGADARQFQSSMGASA